MEYMGYCVKDKKKVTIKNARSPVQMYAGWQGCLPQLWTKVTASFQRRIMEPIRY
jgi:hypothetical protein